MQAGIKPTLALAALRCQFETRYPAGSPVSWLRSFPVERCTHCTVTCALRSIPGLAGHGSRTSAAARLLPTLVRQLREPSKNVGRDRAGVGDQVLCSTLALDGKAPNQISV